MFPHFAFLSVYDRYADDLVVAYGDNDLVKIYEQKKFVEVEYYQIYEDFINENLKNDIALIKLKSPLIFNEAVQPACLPTEHQVFYDGVLKVSGTVYLLA